MLKNVRFERKADTVWLWAMGYGLWAMTPHTCMSAINPPNEITLTALSN